jgi:ribosomal protein S18 acetylase RimI-like enzyme
MLARGYNVDMNVQLLSPGDFDTCYSFWQKAGLQLYPFDEEKKRFDDMLDLNPDLALKLLDVNGEVMGTMIGGFDGRTASIHRLAIHPSLQKKGFGSQLLAYLEEKLKTRGVKKISAQIHISNTQVIPFYEKLGFKEMTYVKLFYRDL